MAPGHLVATSNARADLLQVAWPQSLRLACWGTAVGRGLVPLDAAIDAADLQGATLELGPVMNSGRPLIGLLAEPGAPAPVDLPSDVVAAAVLAGGLTLSLGSPGTVIVTSPASLTVSLWELPVVATPPTESLGTAERHLLEAVNAAATAITELGVLNPDPEARALLARLPGLLDAYPMPAGTSGRARLLRDRAAMLLVGIELALHPTRQASSHGLDEARRTVLVDARAAGRVALQAASNEAALSVG
jgi:hypothetical protein